MTTAAAAVTPEVIPASIAAVVDAGAAQTPEQIAAAALAAGGSDPAAGAATRPEELPEDLWDAATGAPKFADLKTRLEEAATLKAAAEAAATNRYDKPESIEWAVDVKLPDGGAIEFDADSPFLKQAAQVVVEGNVEKPVVKALLTAYANAQLEDQLAAREELKAEFGKLGEPAAATARVKGVEAFLCAAYDANPKTKAQAPALAAAFVRSISSASLIEGIESLMAHHKDPNPGVGGEGGADEALMRTNPGSLLFGKKA